MKTKANLKQAMSCKKQSPVYETLFNHWSDIEMGEKANPPQFLL